MRLLTGRRAFILAVLLGIVAALTSYQYVRQKADTKPEIPMATVVVAAQDIPSRSKLTASMLREDRIPASARHPDALTTIKAAEGQITRLPITRGEQVLSKKFVLERAEAGLSFVIPPSKRAVSIQVSEVIGSGGLIVPGDRVDVIGVFDAKTMGKDMATFLLQDIEVLAVAQTMEEEQMTQQNVAERAGSTLGLGSEEKSDAGKAPVSNPKVQPKAKSITVAVDPEQAQRLILAEERGQLRLALRPQKEGTVVDLVEATLGTIRSPLRMGQAQITAVSISPTRLKAGDTVKVEVTVKNVSNQTVRSQGPEPGYTYVQGQTFHSQNFPSQQGAFRVGINFAGQPAVEYPYRWGLGGDLPPGASATIVGYIKTTSDFEPTNYWAGLIQEPAEKLQDNVGTALVSASPANSVVVAVDMASIRSGPSVSSSIISDVPFGTELTILGQEADWYKVKIPDSGKQGYVAAGWITIPQ